MIQILHTGGVYFIEKLFLPSIKTHVFTQMLNMFAWCAIYFRVLFAQLWEIMELSFHFFPQNQCLRSASVGSARYSQKICGCNGQKPKTAKKLFYSQNSSLYFWKKDIIKNFQFLNCSSNLSEKSEKIEQKIEILFC